MLNLNDLGSLHIQKSYHLTYAVSLFESPKRNASHSHVCASNVGVFVINPCLLCHDCYCLLCHDSFTCVPWLIHMCAMTHSHVCHDSFTCVPWLIHMCAMTHSHMCHDSSMCVPCLIHMCAMTHCFLKATTRCCLQVIATKCVWNHTEEHHDGRPRTWLTSGTDIATYDVTCVMMGGPGHVTVPLVSWASHHDEEWDRHNYIWCDMSHVVPSRTNQWCHTQIGVWSHDGRPRTGLKSGTDIPIYDLTWVVSYCHARTSDVMHK